MNTVIESSGGGPRGHVLVNPTFMLAIIMVALSPETLSLSLSLSLVLLRRAA